MAKTEYREALDVKKIARALIAEHHHALKDAEILYMFRTIASQKGGHSVYGSARKVTGLNAAISRATEAEFFVIEIAEDIWANLTEPQRTALVDHQLAHCDVTNKGALVIRAHDVEDFADVIGRNGLYTRSLADFVEAAQQALPLDLPPAPDDARELVGSGVEG